MKLTDTVALLAIGLLAAIGFLAATGKAQENGPTTGDIQELLRLSCDARIPISKVGTVITKPGSYYLTRTLKSSQLAGDNGIVIQASNVTMDLNGFALLGNGSFGTGVVASGRDITIRNGAISVWGAGIAASSAQNIRVEDISVSGCDVFGIQVGNAALIKNCRLFGNPFPIRTGMTSIVSDCVLLGNQSGIAVSDNCTVTGCTVLASTGSGIVVGDGSTVQDCVVRRTSSGFGIVTGDGCVVSDSTATENKDGIVTGSGCLVSRCVARMNTVDGIRATGDSLIISCDATANGSLNFNALGGTAVLNSHPFP